jgi:Ni,Fe-hydrogenase III small subunit
VPPARVVDLARDRIRLLRDRDDGGIASRFDIARFGPRCSGPPRQLIDDCTVTKKMAPVLRRLYDQMPEPKGDLDGSCSNAGGLFRPAPQGVDKVVPVDVYVGMLPRPRRRCMAQMRLQDKIRRKAPCPKDVSTGDTEPTWSASGRRRHITTIKFFKTIFLVDLLKGQVTLSTPAAGVHVSALAERRPRRRAFAACSGCRPSPRTGADLHRLRSRRACPTTDPLAGTASPARRRRFWTT